MSEGISGGPHRLSKTREIPTDTAYLVRTLKQNNEHHCRIPLSYVILHSNID